MAICYNYYYLHYNPFVHVFPNLAFLPSFPIQRISPFKQLHEFDTTQFLTLLSNPFQIPLNCGKGIVKVKRERGRRKGGKEKRKEGDRGKSHEDGESRAAATFRKLKRRWRVIDLADPRKLIAKTREEKPQTNPTTAGSSRGSESSKTRN